MSAISIVVTKPGATSDPSVLLTESPSCTWVSIAETDASAVGLRRRTGRARSVRPEADSDTESPSAASYQRAEARRADGGAGSCRTTRSTLCTRITGRRQAGCVGSKSNDRLGRGEGDGLPVRRDDGRSDRADAPRSTRAGPRRSGRPGRRSRSGATPRRRTARRTPCRRRRPRRSPVASIAPSCASSATSIASACGERGRRGTGAGRSPARPAARPDVVDLAGEEHLRRCR